MKLNCKLTTTKFILQLMEDWQTNLKLTDSEVLERLCRKYQKYTYDASTKKMEPIKDQGCNRITCSTV